MQTSELGMLADHMGHSLNVHTEVYKLQSNFLERLKIANILIAVENGIVHKYKDKKSVDELVEEIEQTPTLSQGL